MSSTLPPLSVAGRVDRLRAVMVERELDGFVVSDMPSVRWLTGFTGSAGTAVVTADRALFWTDGRYFLQAAEQLKGFELMKMDQPGVPDLEEWARKAGVVVGVDPSLISLSAAAEWERKGCAPFKLVRHNLVDRAWGDAQPRRSAYPQQGSKTRPS